MRLPQFGIFAQGTVAHEFIEFDLRPDVDKAYAGRLISQLEQPAVAEISGDVSRRRTLRRASVRSLMGAKTRQRSAALITEFAKWIIDPDHQGTQNDWATAHGVAPATLSDWKHRPEYKSVIQGWRDSLKESFGEIGAALFAKAKAGDVPAARLLAEVLGEKASGAPRPRRARRRRGDRSQGTGPHRVARQLTSHGPRRWRRARGASAPESLDSSLAPLAATAPVPVIRRRVPIGW